MATPISRYDQPAEAQFINTYVPIPFDDIMKIGLLKQARIDEDMAKQEQMVTEMGSFATGPGFDERRRDEILADVRKDVGDIQGQPGFLDWRQGFADVRSKYAGDPELRDIKYNAKQYEELVKARQKAIEAGVPPANRYELESKISEFVNIGTKGLKEKYGSGQLSLSSYTPYVDTYAKIQEYINDVDLSTVTTESTDKSGFYDITKTTGGRTLNALGAPFGLTFKEERDIEGNVNITPDFTDPEKGSDNFVQNLINKDWGQQYITNAKYKLQTNSLTPEVIQAAAEEAMQEINSAIKERVVIVDSTTFSVNPYGFDLWKDRKDKLKIPLSSKGVTIIEGSEFKDVSGLKAGKAGATELLDEAEKDLAKFKINVRSFPIQNEKGEIIGNEYKRYKPGDPIEGGEDVTQEMRDKIRTRDEFLRKQQGILDYEEEVKEQAAARLGIDPNTKPSVEISRKALSLAIRETNYKIGFEVVKDLAQTTQFFGGNPTQIPEVLKGISGDAKKIVMDEYYKKLDILDPLTRETNKILNINSKNRNLELNLETFSNTESNELLEDWFTLSVPSPSVIEGRKGKDIAKGRTVAGGQVYRDAATNQPLSDADYTRISSKEKARYKGYEFNLNTGGYDVWFKTYTEDPKTGKTLTYKDIKTEAPEGLVQMLVEEGRINDAESYVAAGISKPGLGEGGKTTFNVSKTKKPEYDIFVKKLTSFEKLNSAKTPSGKTPEYRISFSENSAFSGLPGVSNYQAYTPSEAVLIIVDYARKVSEIENNISLQVPKK